MITACRPAVIERAFDIFMDFFDNYLRQ